MFMGFSSFLLASFFPQKYAVGLVVHLAYI